MTKGDSDVMIVVWYQDLQPNMGKYEFPMNSFPPGKTGRGSKSLATKRLKNRSLLLTNGADAEVNGFKIPGDIYFVSFSNNYSWGTSLERTNIKQQISILQTNKQANAWNYLNTIDAWAPSIPDNSITCEKESGVFLWKKTKIERCIQNTRLFV